MSERRPYLAANWKMHKTIEETEAFLGRSEAGRAWAGAVAGALEPLGGDGLPKPPGGEADGATSHRAAAAPPPRSSGPRAICPLQTAS